MATQRSLLTDAAQRAIGYLETLDARAVAPSPGAVAALSALDEPLPEQTGDPRQTLDLLDTLGSPATMAMAGQRFFGFVIGGSLPVALAANWLAGAWDQNSAMAQVTPATARLEQVALRWLLHLLGLPPQCGGAFVTGATVANFAALAAARHAVLARAGWNVEADGLFGAPPIQVVVGDEAHPSVIKSLGLLGLGRDRLQLVPVDAQGRLRVEALPALAGPAIVCTQVGNVNSGACDPVAAVCARAHARSLGARRWRVRVVGRGLARARAAGRGHGPRGLLGHRRAQVAQPALRQRDRVRARRRCTARRDGDHRGVFADRKRRAQSGRLHARTVAARARRRGMGRAAHAGTRRRGRADRTQLPPGAPLRAGTGRGRPRGAQRGRAEPGRGRTAMRISVSSWATTDADVERSLAAMERAVRTARGA